MRRFVEDLKHPGGQNEQERAERWKRFRLAQIKRLELAVSIEHMIPGPPSDKWAKRLNRLRSYT